MKKYDRDLGPPVPNQYFYFSGSCEWIAIVKSVDISAQKAVIVWINLACKLEKHEKPGDETHITFADLHAPDWVYRKTRSRQPYLGSCWFTEHKDIMHETIKLIRQSKTLEEFLTVYNLLLL